jgi:hypothetical protein
MRKRGTSFAGALIVISVIAGSVSAVATVGGARGAPGDPLSACNNGRPPGFHLESTIAFSSTRDNPTGVPVADAAWIDAVSGWSGTLSCD